jgi:tetratricopeptide (TPR) repeat protein
LATGRTPAERLTLMESYSEARKLLASGDQTNYQEAETLLRKVDRQARQLGFEDIEARAKLALALAKELTGHWSEAIEAYEAIDRQAALKSPLARVDAVAGRARGLMLTGELRYALYLLEQLKAVLEAENLREPSAIVRLNTSLVAGYFQAGLKNQAKSAAEEALNLAEFVEDPERLANMHMNVARIFLDAKNWGEAHHQFDEAERHFSHLQYKVKLAEARLARGFALVAEERFDEARPLLAQARETFQAAKDTLNEAGTLSQLARLERRAGNPDQAELLAKGAIALARGVDGGLEGIAHRELALARANRPDMAEKDLRRSIQLLEREGNKSELAISYRELGDLLRGHKDLEDACAAYVGAYEAVREALDPAA